MDNEQAPFTPFQPTATPLENSEDPGTTCPRRGPRRHGQAKNQKKKPGRPPGRPRREQTPAAPRPPLDLAKVIEALAGLDKQDVIAVAEFARHLEKLAPDSRNRVLASLGKLFA